MKTVLKFLVTVLTMGLFLTVEAVMGVIAKDNTQENEQDLDRAGGVV